MSEEATLDEFTKTTVSQGRQETPVGELPADWGIEWLKDVVEINPDGFSKDDWPSETFEYISLSETSEGEIEGSTTTPLEEAPSRAQRTVQRGDVLVGTVRPKQRSHGFVSEEHAGKICSSGFGVLRTESRLNSRYLLQEILSNRFFSQMEAYVAGSGYPAVKISDLKKHRVAIPPLPEQRKIATVLYTVDRAIEKTEAIVGRLERFHKGLFQSLIPRGIGHKQYDDARILGRNVQIPTSWDVTSVSEACSEIIDYRGKNPEFSDEGIPHLRNINIGRGEILLDDLKYVSEGTYDDWMTRGIPQEGDTLLSTEAPMGKTAVLPEMKFCLSQRLIVLRPGEQFDNQFFAHLVGSPFIQKEYEARATGSTVKGISNYNLQDITVPVPPKREQEEIAQRIDETLDVLQANEQEVDRLKRLKRGLMQDLLSGTVRTTDTNIDVPDEIAQHG